MLHCSTVLYTSHLIAVSVGPSIRLLECERQLIFDGRIIAFTACEPLQRAHSLVSRYPSPQPGHYGPQVGNLNTDHTYSLYAAGSPNIRDRLFSSPRGGRRNETCSSLHTCQDFRPCLLQPMQTSNNHRPLDILLHPQRAQVSAPLGCPSQQRDGAASSTGTRWTTTVPNTPPEAQAESTDVVTADATARSFMTSPQRSRRVHR